MTLALRTASPTAAAGWPRSSAMMTYTSRRGAAMCALRATKRATIVMARHRGSRGSRADARCNGDAQLVITTRSTLPCTAASTTRIAHPRPRSARCCSAICRARSSMRDGSGGMVRCSRSSRSHVPGAILGTPTPRMRQLLAKPLTQQLQRGHTRRVAHEGRPHLRSTRATHSGVALTMHLFAAFGWRRWPRARCACSHLIDLVTLLQAVAVRLRPCAQAPLNSSRCSLCRVCGQV